MFRGRYHHTIDPKGRLSVPSKYRDVLAQYDGSTLIVVPNEQAIEVHPLQEWERIEAKINEQSSMFDPEVRRMGRLYVSRAKDVEIDTAGRILLPPDTRAQAAILREVTLIGVGRKLFEIWDRKRFEEYERVNGDGLPTGFERLAQLGV